MRQDVLRGLRWGLVALLAVLLAIAGFRATNSAPATARDATPPLHTLPPAAPVAIEVGAAQQSPTALVPRPPRAGAPKPVRRSSKTAASVDAKPVPGFTPHAPRPVPAPDLVVEALPEPPELQASPSHPALAPPPVISVAPPPKQTKSSPVDAAGRIFRSVGRVFGIGRRDPPSGGKDK
jgi:hypothetical protein